MKQGSALVVCLALAAAACGDSKSSGKQASCREIAEHAYQLASPLYQGEQRAEWVASKQKVIDGVGGECEKRKPSATFRACAMNAKTYDVYMACGRAEEGKAAEDELPDDLNSNAQRPDEGNSVEERPEEEEDKPRREEGRYRLKETGP